MIGRPIAQPCGTRAAYSRGCRCDPCLAATKAYHRQQRNGTPQDDVPLPTGPPVPGDWFTRAACRGSDVREFFPGKGAKTAHLRAICEACPVRDQCLEWALDADIVDGFWGGVSARGRRDLRMAR